MTDKRILELAYVEALRIWTEKKAFLEKYPDNSIASAKEAKAWDEVEEIRKMMMDEGKVPN